MLFEERNSLMVVGGHATGAGPSGPAENEFQMLHIEGSAQDEDWASLADMPTSRPWGPSAAFAGGRIVVAGGGDAPDVDLFQPGEDKWSTVANGMNYAKQKQATTTVSAQFFPECV